MVATPQFVTKEEAVAIKAKGGGGMLIKLDAIKVKLIGGKGNETDAVNYQSMAARCRALINPGQAPENVGLSGYPRDLEDDIATHMEMAILQMRERVNSGEITEDEYGPMIKQVMREVEDRRVARYKFLYYASGLKVKGLPIKIRSGLVDDVVTLVASEAAARKVDPDSGVVYTVDEVVSLLRSNATPDRWRQVHNIKREMDGQISLDVGGAN